MHARSHDEKQLEPVHRRKVSPCPRLVTFRNLPRRLVFSSLSFPEPETCLRPYPRLHHRKELLIDFNLTSPHICDIIPHFFLPLSSPSFSCRFSSLDPCQYQYRRKGWVMVSLYLSQRKMISAPRRLDQQIPTDQLRDQATDQQPAEII